MDKKEGTRSSWMYFTFESRKKNPLEQVTSIRPNRHTHISWNVSKDLENPMTLQKDWIGVGHSNETTGAFTIGLKITARYVRTFICIQHEEQWSLGMVGTIKTRITRPSLRLAIKFHITIEKRTTQVLFSSRWTWLTDLTRTLSTYTHILGLIWCCWCPHRSHQRQTLFRFFFRSTGILSRCSVFTIAHVGVFLLSFGCWSLKNIYLISSWWGLDLKKKRMIIIDTQFWGSNRIEFPHGFFFFGCYWYAARMRAFFSILRDDLNDPLYAAFL